MNDAAVIVSLHMGKLPKKIIGGGFLRVRRRSYFYR